MSEDSGGGRRGGYGLRITISGVIHTWIRQSHGLGQTLTVGVTITDAPCTCVSEGGDSRGVLLLIR